MGCELEEEEASERWKELCICPRYSYSGGIKMGFDKRDLENVVNNNRSLLIDELMNIIESAREIAGEAALSAWRDGK